MASPIFRINGGSPGVKASVSAAGAVTATLDSIDGVRSTEWFIDTTDETTEPADYTLVQSGSVGQTVDTTALTAGTAAKMRARINGGINLATGLPDPDGTNATAKFYVPTSLGREVGCAGEEFESDATYGSSGIINSAVRETGGIAITDIVGTAPITVTGTTTRTVAFGTFPNTADATISVDSVAAGDGKNLLLDAGDVTAGGGSGGSIALTPGTNAGGATGNVVCVMPLGSGGTSGMFKLNDGTNNFLDAKATAALTTITFDRQLLLTGGTNVTLEATASLTISADTGAGGNDLIFKRSSAEKLRIVSGGLEIEKGYVFSLTQPQSTSGAGRDMTIQAQRGVAGTNGGDLVLTVGAAGTGGSNLQGECVIALGNSGDPTGILRVTGGAFGDLLTLQYDDSAGETSLTSPQALQFTTPSTLVARSTGADATISCGNASSLFLAYGAGLTTRIEIDATGIGVFNTAPASQQSVTGSRGGNAALASLLTALANFGWIVDNTTA